MLDPVERERIEAAVKSALGDANLTIAECGRRLGRGSSWVGLVLSRVREGYTLTVESVRVMSVEVPSLPEHLKIAGWTAFGAQKRRPVIATRSTEHLRLHLNHLTLKRSELDEEIRETQMQIAELEEIAKAG